VQSSVAEVFDAVDPASRAIGSAAAHPRMQAIIAAAERFKSLRPGEKIPAPPPRPSGGIAPSAEPVLEHCAGALLELVFGTLSEKAHAVVELNPFGSCDAGWLRVLASYLKFLWLRGRIPYIPPQSAASSRLEVLPERSRLGIIGDWGTGTETALEVLRQLARFRDAEPAVPFILLHLGDVYYAGIASEFARFVMQCRALFPKEPIFTLSGNHDMYCGGKPYYDTIASLNEPPFVQKTSFFCLRNRFWQFQAMDTGLHDRDAFEVDRELTYLEPEEVIWQQQQLKDAGDRKVVLLSHHPPFSAFGSVGYEGTADLFVNRQLLSTFDGTAPAGDGTNYLGKVVLWLFGHEHNTIIYKPNYGVERGVCLGSSAIPVVLADEPYAEATKTVSWRDDIRLALRGDEFSHGYAVMDISGAQGTISYYQYPAPEGQDLLYREQL
jgi:hypothetical protein